MSGIIDGQQLVIFFETKFTHGLTMGKPTLKIHLILASVIAFYCLDFFYRISPGLVQSALINQYTTDALGFSSFASAFYLGYVLFQLPAGVMLDKFTVKNTVIMFIAICNIAFLCFIYSSNLSVGILSRFILGAASSLSFIVVLHVARNFYSKKFFGFISGITIAAGTLGGSLIQIIYSVVMDKIAWQKFFALSVIVGFCICCYFALIKHDQKAQDAIPLSKSKTNYKTLFKDTLALIKTPGFITNGLLGGLFYLPTSLLAAAWGVSLFELNYGLNKAQAALCITLLFCGWSVGSPLIGYLNDNVRHYRNTIMISSTLAGIISILVINYVNLLGHYVYGAIFLLGLFSSAQVSVWNIFNRICPKNISGIGISLTNMLIMISPSLFHCIEGLLVKYYSSSQLAFNTAVTSTGLTRGLWLIPGIFFISALVAMFLPRNDRLQYYATLNTLNR